MAVCLQQANLLLRDSVAGVGYSYSLDTNDYTTNDTQAQIDMEATLRTWFQEYPYFANHSVILEGTAQHEARACCILSYSMVHRTNGHRIESHASHVAIWPSVAVLACM